MMKDKGMHNDARKTGIWIDSTKAILVTVLEDKYIVEEIPSEIESRTHHKNEGDKGSFGGSRFADNGSIAGTLRLDNNKKFDERRQHQVSRFLDNVMVRIRNAGTIAILGPAQMKQKLHSRVLEEQDFNPMIAALEASGKLTEKQLVAKVNEIFEKSAAG